MATLQTTSITGSLSATGELFTVSNLAKTHEGNVEAYYQLSKRLQAFNHLGSTTVLEIEAITLAGGYSGQVERTTWRLQSRGQLNVTRHDENGGASYVTLKVLNDTSVADANGQNAKYVVGLICGTGSNYRMVYLRARFLEYDSTSRWVTIAQMATATPTTVSGSAMTYSSGWVANTGYTDTSFTEVIILEKASQLTLTATTGTAPLVVSSTTLVSNLNAQYLNGQLGSYYLNAANLTGTISGDRGVTAGSSSVSFVEYNGTTATAGQFDGGSTAPSGTTRLNYGGYLYATRFYGDGSNLTSLAAGNLSGTIPSAVLGNSSFYLGTTQIALNRASANIALTGITSIDGNAATVTNGLYTNTAQTITAVKTVNNLSNTFINTVTTANQAITFFQDTIGADAYLTFHIGSDYAGYFGLGGAENDLVWGGWSVGNNRYRILHSGNQSYAWNLNQNLRTTDTPTFAGLISSGSVKGDAGANYPHSFTNTDAGNTHWTNRNDRLLTSNGTNWATDGRDPIMALVTSGNSNATTIANSIGLTLHNESQTNNTFSPAITFSNRSNSGNYNSVYAAIIGKKTGQGVDSNWSAGELHFYTMPVGAYENDVPSLLINSAGNVGIGTTNPATLFQIGTGTPTSATGGLQFGDDTGTRIYRSGSNTLTMGGTFVATTFSGTLSGNASTATASTATNGTLPTSWSIGIIEEASVKPFLFNTLGDVLAFQTISNLQYWDGSAWQSYTNSSIQEILTGNIQTASATVTPTNRKFRFEFTGAGAYIGGGVLVVHQVWSNGAHQLSSLLEYWNGSSWVTVITERSSTGGGGENDYHFYNRGNIHGNWTQYRVTITSADTVNNTVYTGIQLLYDYTRQSLPNNFLPFSWDYRRNISINGTTVQNSASNRGNITLNGQSAILNFSISSADAGYLYHDGTNILLNNKIAGYLAFHTNNLERIRILSGGNVGIGTTNPAALLQVGTGTPTAATGGLQFGDDTGARLYRDSSSRIRTSSHFASGGHIQTLNDEIYSSAYSATLNIYTGNTAQNAWLAGITLSPGGNVRIPGGLVNAGLSAQWSVSGGGTATFSGGYITWSQRVIAIPVEKTEFSAQGYIDINCPTSGTVVYYNSSDVTTTVTCTASGIPLGQWEALYYEITPGQTNTSDQTKFRVVAYPNSVWRPSSNWLLLAIRNTDAEVVRWIPGQANIKSGGSYDFSRATEYFYADNYYLNGGTSTFLRSNNAVNFLTNAGNAQTSKFANIQVSSSYSGTLPTDGILFGTDSNLYRTSTDTLKTDDSLIINSKCSVATSISATYTVDINGSLHYTSASASSDARFKKNIEPIDNALIKLNNVRGVKFEWNEFVNARRNGYELNKPTLGVIAQELEAVFPELVDHWHLSDDCPDARAVNYEKIIPVLIEAVKELNNKNIQLEARLSALESKLQ